MNIITEIFATIVDFIIPSHCFGCGKSLLKGKIICEKCFKQLEKVPDKICTACGMAQKHCECADYVYHFKGVCAPFYNKGVAQRGIYSLKFRNQPMISHFYVPYMKDIVLKHFSNAKISLVCSIPMQPNKELSKEYNHAHLLASELAKSLGIKYKTGILKRKAFGRTQHKRGSVQERFENADINYSCKGKLNGETVLLVDDIKTSGASLDACARALLYAGADEVYCVTALITDKTVEKEEKF